MYLIYQAKSECVQTFLHSVCCFGIRHEVDLPGGLSTACLLGLLPSMPNQLLVSQQTQSRPGTAARIAIQQLPAAHMLAWDRTGAIVASHSYTPLGKKP
jgi:hypothetical protein